MYAPLLSSCSEKAENIRKEENAQQGYLVVSAPYKCMALRNILLAPIQKLVSVLNVYGWRASFAE